LESYRNPAIGYGVDFGHGTQGMWEASTTTPFLKNGHPGGTTRLRVRVGGRQAKGFAGPLLVTMVHMWTCLNKNSYWALP